LKPNSSTALHRHSHAVVEALPPECDSSISAMMSTEKPDVRYEDIGGMDVQKQEVREAVELPLTHFELYKQIGIDPPSGVLLYGPPGTGKVCCVLFVEKCCEGMNAIYLMYIYPHAVLPYCFVYV
jgi:26S proteasome regulatory subunit T3